MDSFRPQSLERDHIELVVDFLQLILIMDRPYVHKTALLPFLLVFGGDEKAFFHIQIFEASPKAEDPFAIFADQ